MEIDLSRCPFCGSFTFFHLEISSNDLDAGKYELECDDCGLQILEDNREDFLKRFEAIEDLKNY